MLKPRVKVLLSTLRDPKTSIGQKVKFSIDDFSSKCDQIRRELWIWLHLLEKFLMENYIFCIVQGDIIPITEDDGESPKKRRPWNSEEEKESTMTLKMISFEIIPEEDQKNWKVPDEMANYAEKYF